MTTLADLIPLLPGARLRAGADAATAVVDVAHDSRDAGPGVLFACRPGATRDGHDFASDAAAAGAAALLSERELPLPVPQLVVPSVAAALGPVAAAVHGRPSEALLLLGVTGTNGKTTTAFLLEAALRAAGHVTGLIGTVETRVAGEVVHGVRTTPEATDLQRLLARMRDRGATAAAMEVSSHGLALGRVAGTRFAAVLFTNLTQDHLDFHGDLEAYFAAKASLFAPAYAPVGLVNVDDAWGRRLLDRATTPVRTLSPSGAAADVRAVEVVAGAAGARFTAEVLGRRVPASTRLPGGFNVANAVAAIGTAALAGIDPAVAAEGVAALEGVPGRMERVDAGQPFTVLVDYAHTPDSLDNVLRAARGITRPPDGRVLVVVGCGGDRDRGKRPLMGRAAASLADLAVLTSDNPRSEDPQAILDAVVAGAAEVAGARWLVEPDRRAAISEALAAARPGDVVVVAGKGHETYQELADRTIDFDDRAVARAWLEGRA